MNEQTIIARKIIGIVFVIFSIEQWISPFIMPGITTLASWLTFIIFLVGLYLIFHKKGSKIF